jgi:hypothetical protein
MALARYKLTSTVTVPAGTAAAVVAGEPGTGGAAGYGSALVSAGIVPARWAAGFTFIKGIVIMLDPAGAVYAAIGGGNLTPFTGAQESGGIDGVSN